MAGVGFAAYLLVRRSRIRQRSQALLFVVASAIPAGIACVTVMRELPLNLPVHSPWFWPLAITLAVGAAAAIVWKPQAVARFAGEMFLHSWLVLAFILIQAARMGLSPAPAEFRDRPSAPKLSGTPAVRVVWVIFDGLSRKIAFEQRPAGLELPNLDRLRSETFYASAAEPPGDATLVCLPAMILGREVTHASPHGTRYLELTTNLGREQFGSDPGGNVFDDARALGYNTALAGWYHPYCRILNNSLTSALGRKPGWARVSRKRPANNRSQAKWPCMRACR